MAAPVFVGRAHELAALRAGASGFLLKETPPADLLAAIRVIAVGDALLALAITGGSSPNSPDARNPASSPPRPWQTSPTGSARS